MDPSSTRRVLCSLFRISLDIMHGLELRHIGKLAMMGFQNLKFSSSRWMRQRWLLLSILSTDDLRHKVKQQSSEHLHESFGTFIDKEPTCHDLARATFSQMPGSKQAPRFLDSDIPKKGRSEHGVILIINEGGLQWQGQDPEERRGPARQPLQPTASVSRYHHWPHPPASLPH